VTDNEFFLDTISDLTIVHGGGTFTNNYQEQNNDTVTNVVIGTVNPLPQPTTRVFQPLAVTLGPGNILNCGNHATNPVIAINRGSVINIEMFSLGSCTPTQFIQNSGNASGITIRRNLAVDGVAKTLATWINSLVGVQEQDISPAPTSTLPTGRTLFSQIP
jgi:hypothetical protein